MKQNIVKRIHMNHNTDRLKDLITIDNFLSSNKVLSIMCALIGPDCHLLNTEYIFSCLVLNEKDILGMNDIFISPSLFEDCISSHLCYQYVIFILSLVAVLKFLRCMNQFNLW